MRNKRGLKGQREKGRGERRKKGERKRERERQDKKLYYRNWFT